MELTAELGENKLRGCESVLSQAERVASLFSKRDGTNGGSELNKQKAFQFGQCFFKLGVTILIGNNIKNKKASVSWHKISAVTHNSGCELKSLKTK